LIDCFIGCSTSLRIFMILPNGECIRPLTADAPGLSCNRYRPLQGLRWHLCPCHDPGVACMQFLRVSGCHKWQRYGLQINCRFAIRISFVIADLIPMHAVFPLHTLWYSLSSWPYLSHCAVSLAPKAIFPTAIRYFLPGTPANNPRPMTHLDSRAVSRCFWDL